MKIKIIVLLSLQLSIYTLFGQNIIGKWYEIEDLNASLEITIEKNNGKYSGTFTSKRKNWINIVNAPLDNVLIKNDSLFLESTQADFPLNYKLKWDGETHTYKGFSYYMSQRLR